ncbi:MAG: hypothetical protein HC866_09365 [Leptolyngbyaceae cyanobacterium RU_5_1]|nr:hypothetical protein [Leptolyngbyaceae cyanobacterium RU_5_1]
MSEYQITLPEKVYHTLLTIAEQQGITPADWIAAQLSTTTSEEQPLPNLLADLVGAIDSRAEPRHQFQKTRFGEGIAAKLARQGLRRP